MTNYYDKSGNRKEPYAEDTTKGASLMKPLNYKHDVVTQAWIDSRILATLAMWMESNNCPAKSFSDLCRRPLELLVEILTSNGNAELVDDTARARNYLETRFRIKLNRNEKGTKNVLHNQILTSQRKDLGETMISHMSSRNRTTDADIPAYNPRPRMIDDNRISELVQQAESLQVDPTKHREEYLKQLEADKAEFLANGGTFAEVKNETE